MLNIGLLLWFFKYTSAKCEKVPIICAFFSSSKLSPSEEWPALQVVMVDEVDKNYTAPKWVPIWGPGSPWGPFSEFRSSKGPHVFSRSPLSPFHLDRFLGPHLCWQRSPLGPHLTQNWVPILNKIGSPWHMGALGVIKSMTTPVVFCLV